MLVGFAVCIQALRIILLNSYLFLLIEPKTLTNGSTSSIFEAHALFNRFIGKFTVNLMKIMYVCIKLCSPFKSDRAASCLVFLQFKEAKTFHWLSDRCRSLKC